jgi:hypothetical protein
MSGIARDISGGNAERVGCGVPISFTSINDVTETSESDSVSLLKSIRTGGGCREIEDEFGHGQNKRIPIKDDPEKAVELRASSYFDLLIYCMPCQATR